MKSGISRCCTARATGPSGIRSRPRRPPWLLSAVSYFAVIPARLAAGSSVGRLAADVVLDCVEQCPHVRDHLPDYVRVGVQRGLEYPPGRNPVQDPQEFRSLCRERLDRVSGPELVAGISGEVGADLPDSLGRIKVVGREDADCAVEQRRGDLDSVSLRDGA